MASHLTRLLCGFLERSCPRQMVDFYGANNKHAFGEMSFEPGCRFKLHFNGVSIGRVIDCAALLPNRSRSHLGIKETFFRASRTSIRRKSEVSEVGCATPTTGSETASEHRRETF
ncbi:hypothetical protein EVAR_20429_1 [Eumeta japonica]|uniref:Uncharacterized protein n=1 Tax=Eumeta variegata TaxID=151549 RepID=A0A4C1TY00_EUMVA|nr:hypothetical protein EVAR_20429_1 [Eumeta japonica]